MATQNDSLKSRLALAIEQRERKLFPFEVQGFFGLGNKQIQQIAIRVAVKSEEDEALVAAHARVKELTRGDKEAMDDADLTQDQKLIQILHRVCFSPDEKTKDGVPYPAFPGPEWMRKNLTTDQIACIINLYHEVRRVDGPLRGEISTEEVLAVAEGCAVTANTDMPEALLATSERTWLTQAFVLLAIQWKELADVQRDSGYLGGEEADEPGDAEAGAGSGGEGDAAPPEGGSG